MRRFIVPPSIALVAMGVLCLVSRNFVPLIRGRDVRKDAKRLHDSLPGSGSFQRPFEPHSPNSHDALRDGASFPGAVV
jgi:hypothetical protein